MLYYWKKEIASIIKQITLQYKKSLQRIKKLSGESGRSELVMKYNCWLQSRPGWTTVRSLAELTGQGQICPCPGDLQGLQTTRKFHSLVLHSSRKDGLSPTLKMVYGLPISIVWYILLNSNCPQILTWPCCQLQWCHGMMSMRSVKVGTEQFVTDLTIKSLATSIGRWLKKLRFQEMEINVGSDADF